jgi:hypothetical protein
MDIRNDLIELHKDIINLVNGRKREILIEKN